MEDRPPPTRIHIHTHISMAGGRNHLLRMQVSNMHVDFVFSVVLCGHSLQTLTNGTSHTVLGAMLLEQDAENMRDQM